MAKGCPVDEDFDPLSPDYLADPFAILASMDVEERPVFYAPSIDYYVLTRHADIEQVFRDPATFSALVAQAPLVPLAPETLKILLASDIRAQPNMATQDEPAHGRLRKPASRAFSVKRVAAMAPAITAASARLLDAVADQEEFDLVAAFAFPLPADILLSLMGVPKQDQPQLKQYCSYRAALSWGRPEPADQVEIAASFAATWRYLHELVEVKSREPGDDLTSDLLAIHREDPGQLTLDEIASILFALSFAGTETTTGLIGNTVRRLLEEPARWTRIVEKPGLIAGAVDETLRYDPPVPVWRRVTTRPVTLGGVNLPKGARLFLWLAAAGRDRSVFHQPQQFDPGRPDVGQHLAFGLGAHYCLGANLGKLETQLALEELVRRYPRLRLAEDQQFTFHPNISFRGPQELRVVSRDSRRR